MLALYVLLPVLCIAAAGGQARSGGERIVYGVALYQSILFAVGMVLGLTHALTPSNYSLATGCAVVALAVPAWRHRPSCHPDLRPLLTRRGAFISAIALGILGTAGIQVARDAAWGTGHGDGLWYHLPRMIAWSRQAGFEAWYTPTWSQVGLPVGADVVLGAKVFLGLGWAGVTWVTAVLTLGGAACVYVAALDLGLGRTRALLAAILFVSFPAIGRRIGAVNSDIAAAFPVMAAYVVLVRGEGHGRTGAFLFLNALGVACRPTVAPLAVIVAILAVWRAPRKPRLDGLAVAGALAGTAAVAASYWPVYAAFRDPLGGSFGRAHTPADAGMALRAVVVSAAQWAMEPIGYLPGEWLQGHGRALAWRVLQFLGAPFPGGPYAASQGMATWTAYRVPDVGRSGLVPLLGLPLLAVLVPARARRIALPALAFAFVLVSGMVYLQPWSSRFTVIVLAGYALLWASPAVFARRKWLLPVIVALNVAVGLLATARATAAAAGTRSRGEFPAWCIDADQRAQLARELAGAPLLLVSEGNICDALLAGPDLAFEVRYVACPSDGGWERILEAAGRASSRLAVNHRGQESFVPGPVWTSPRVEACPETSKARLDEALAATGWRLWKAGEVSDLWEIPGR